MNIVVTRYQSSFHFTLGRLGTPLPARRETPDRIPMGHLRQRWIGL
jgi:hypothetical protein